ncbi:MAG: hypothetical protein HY540_07975 [Deltaproteobacteria bacterium]|nr:hypothetical protein [Deltaproteobacteria bacterium]
MKKTHFFAMMVVSALQLTPVFAQELPKTDTSDWTFYQQAGHRSPEWDKFVKSGFQALSGNNLATAGLLFQKAYSLGCRDGLVLAVLGLYTESKKNLKEAKMYYVEAAQKMVDTYPTHQLTKTIGEHTGRVLVELGESDAALPYFESALKYDPQNITALTMSGHVLREQTRFNESRSRLTTALALPAPSPATKVAILTELLATTFAMTDYEGTISYAEELLKLSPNNLTAITFRNRSKQGLVKKKEREMIERMTQ